MVGLETWLARQLLLLPPVAGQHENGMAAQGLARQEIRQLVTDIVARREVQGKIGGRLRKERRPGLAARAALKNPRWLTEGLLSEKALTRNPYLLDALRALPASLSAGLLGTVN